MSPTCDAARWMELQWSRKGYGGHGKGVHFSWGLHRRRVLRWRGEVDLIVKVVLELLSSTTIQTEEQLDATSIYRMRPPLGAVQGLPPWSLSPSLCSRSHNSLATPQRPQEPSTTPAGTHRGTVAVCPLCPHLRVGEQTQSMVNNM